MRRKLAIWGISLALGSAVTCGVLTSAVTTRIGINKQIQTREIPLYLKGLEFVSRHAHYDLLAREIVQGFKSDRDRMPAVFDWTRANIRRTPDGWTIVDDHIWSIIVRGHGTDDQIADVFTTLATYAGVPAFWMFLRAPETSSKLTVSFAQVGGKWVVVDVANGLMFRNRRGDLADAGELSADKGLIAQAAGPLSPNGIAYLKYFTMFRAPAVPRPLRAELQMPSRRLWHSVRRGDEGARSLDFR